ncbi:MAG TPA: DapH/DapD/GlmU-related protein [Haliangiales bacterium]|nr:DapH/DapD/GlmU-related protein [Haliangiales bacterium]
MSLTAFPRAHPRLIVPETAGIVGTVHVGPGVLVAQGTVVRSRGGSVAIGAGSAVLENSAVVGTPDSPVTVGRRSVFGHRCLVVGAAVGDLCEIGNGSILLPGARLGDRCFLGEGTLVPAGARISDEAVVVGRPARQVRRANAADLARLRGLRDGNLDVPAAELHPHTGRVPAGGNMGKRYAYRDKMPAIAPGTVLFDSAEITGDVVIGGGSIIGAGVKILGDSHGPVRIGARVQILENSVLHLLPDNELILEDDVIVGPGCMIHGCRIGAGSVVEPGAIVCDFSRLGRGCIVRAGAVVKQRSEFGDGVAVDGFPAVAVERLAGPPPVPSWAFSLDDLPEALP